MFKHEVNFAEPNGYTSKMARIDEMFDENGRFIPRYARGIKASDEKGLCGLDLEIRRINESWQEVRCSGRGVVTSVLEATTEEAVALHCRSCRKNPQRRRR